ncbi:CheY-homologous receiver domain containing protein kinase-like protein [Klebsormidium nitens]|uniref:non-specific serine/threonine protein kinase n=1 Tax=Klebsormidium nitens TaxID=105231 RepID=A0A1Y1IHI1_KLENI|nr:CheY-homologous receiver domain containing protein kinase-like protein [Klebsormidium nitens]|eukprot:GAQ90330.1 CheY-homologous receiver domain containing protein kinase-like protein [Klebsormidium nitens]
MQHYSKSDEILGSSEFKTVYSGFDHKQGVAIAWSVIDLKSGECTDQLVRTLQLIQRVEHDHIVLNGPLLIRNLRMGNVLIHQDVGIIKLDLLSVSFIFTSHGHAREKVEQIRIMAPECVLGPTDERVDVYGFGMVMLEAATRVQPYKECSTFASLFDKVTHFQPPTALAQVQNSGLRDIIRKTFLRAADRPSAQELLQLPYFRFEPSLWGMHVVVIDDDPVNLKVCSRLLEKEGVTVVPCSTFGEVVTLLSTRAFSAVITDIIMPQMNGLELTKKLRQLRYNSLMIIGVSAVKRDDMDERMGESGMDAFLQKPFNFENLRVAFTRARLKRTSSAKDL